MATRIMVVDDEDLIRQLLAYQLGGAGYEVSIADSGRDALARLLVDQPDLVLLDVMMPDMSGWELCRQIRTCSAVPIIMLTAKGSDEDVVTGLTAGADDYITKPYSLSQLLARVEAVLRRTHRLHMSVIRSGGGIEHHAAQPSRQRHELIATTQSALTPLPRPSVANPPTPQLALSGLGQRLATARRLRGLSLYQAEQACGIRWEFLQALEYEHFTYIPRSQLRHALRSYCMYLGIDLRDFAPRQSAPASTLPRWLLTLTLVVTIMFITVVMVASLRFSGILSL